MATVNDKAAWLAERRNGLGGSDIAKIFGLSKFGTAVDVWLDKRGEAPEVAENEAMKLGTFLEPYVAGRFSEETGLGLIEYQPMIHGTGDKAFALANLDRVVVENGQDVNEMVARLGAGDLSCIEAILECKTATRMDDWHDENGNFIVPEYYRCQVLHYLGLVPSAKRIYVAVYFTGLNKGFECGVIERNDALIEKMFGVERAWWQKHIVEGAMPEANTAKEVVTLYPRSNPESEVVATDEIKQKLTAYKAIQKEIDAFEKETDADGKTREERLEELKTDITKEMKDKEFLVDTDEAHTVLATFKSGNDTVKDICDWEAVAKAMAEALGEPGADILAEMAAKHTQKGVVTRKGSRPFRVKAERKAASSGSRKASRAA